MTSCAVNQILEALLGSSGKKSQHSERRQGQAVAADAVAAGELRNQVLITVLGDVTRSYVLIRTLQLRVAIAEQAIDAQRQSAQVVRTRFARGITNELDVALANRELETTEAVLAPLQARLVAAKRNLAVLLGEPPDSLMRELVSESPLPTPPTEVAAGLPGDLLRRRPDVRQAEAQIIAANARLGVAISNLYPRIFLTAGGGVQGQGLGRTPVTWRGVWSAGPTVEWPLLDFGTVDAQIQQQDQITREQVANYRKMILAAIQQVDDSLTNYDAERSRLGSLTRAVAAAQRALELATERYNRGIINYLNVVDAERELYNLQDQFAVSENTAVADFVDICQSLGGGWQGFAPPPPLRQPLPAILATANVWDNGLAGGDRNLTQVIQYASTSHLDTDLRTTAFGYDFRDRRTGMTDPMVGYTAYSYDNLDRQTMVQRYTSPGGNLIAQNATNYDDRGRVYQRIVYAVDPSTGIVGNSLVGNSWYDDSGNLLKQVNPGDGIVFSKSAYNGVNRKCKGVTTEMQRGHY